MATRPATLDEIEWRIAHLYSGRAAHSSIWRRVLADLVWLVEQARAHTAKG